jgi:F-box protein 20
LEELGELVVHTVRTETPSRTGKGAAMIIESLSLFYHLPCFRCYVCGVSLGSGVSGADVRVRAGKLHCHACYSNDEGERVCACARVYTCSR